MALIRLLMLPVLLVACTSIVLMFLFGWGIKIVGEWFMHGANGMTDLLVEHTL